MADPFIGEIRMMPYNFTQEGWFACTGGIVSVSDFTSLFSIIGDTFGGNGHSTFGLPDLRGRVPVHPGSTFGWGFFGGYNRIVLGTQHMPVHRHEFRVSNQDADTDTPAGQQPSNASLGIVGGSVNVYAPYTIQDDLQAMETGAISTVGGNNPHDNMQPYQAMGFFIAHEGLYPSRS